MENKRLEHEKQHGRKIVSDAEKVWNWSSPAGKRRAERRADFLIKIPEIKKEDEVLEIGCGTGLFTEKLFNATRAKITGIDISEDLLEIARKKLPEVNFLIDDAMSLSFADESFNVVCGSSVLHHLEMETAYKEFYRVLKPGGKMVFAEPNMVNPQILVQKNVPFIKRWAGDSPDETAIIRWKTARQLKNAGFKNIRIIPYDFLHPATPSFLINCVETFGKTIEKIPLIKEIAGSVIISCEKHP